MTTEEQIARTAKLATILMDACAQLAEDPRLDPTDRARMAEADRVVGQLALDLGLVVPTAREEH
jgi:hypothetical protein